MKYSAFVYGHYDSRGGTMAVIVKDHSQESMRAADQVYLDQCGMAGEEEWADVIKEDRLGPATIEWNGEGELELGRDYDEDEWAVIVMGQDPLEHGWPEDKSGGVDCGPPSILERRRIRVHHRSSGGGQMSTKLRAMKVDQGQVHQVFERVMGHGAGLCDEQLIDMMGGTAGVMIDYLAGHWQAPKAVVVGGSKRGGHE